MAVSRVFFGILAVAVIVLSVSIPAVQAQTQPPTPAPAPPPSSDGTSIDQGIAYVLMLVALVLTYLIHAADISHSF